MMKISEEGKVPSNRDWIRYTKVLQDQLRHKFPGSASIKCNWSQSFQDIFVLSILNGKRNGFYVEIGADQPRIYNNSYLLETDYSWDGVSFELDADKVEFFDYMRRNPCVCTDATTFDYRSLFREKNYPKQIDYLSLDIEPSNQTLNALKQLPLDEYRFSVITFETDLYQALKATLAYADDPELQEAIRDQNKAYHVESKARTILRSYGYELLLENIMHKSNPYEDWWIDPNVVDPEIVNKFRIEYDSFISVARPGTMTITKAELDILPKYWTIDGRDCVLTS